MFAACTIYFAACIIIYLSLFSVETDECKLIELNGTVKRLYMGNVHLSTNGSCKNWKLGDKKYLDYPGVGDHNYCRNIGIEPAACFTDEGYVSCNVKSCGEYLSNQPHCMVPM